MGKLLTCFIQVGDISFDFLTEVAISDSRKQLTNTAVIELPRNIRIKRVDESGSLLYQDINQVFKREDAVKIDLGYDGNNTTEFEGFLAYIKTGSPLKLECEDHTYLLKQNTIKFSSENASLKDIIKAINTPGFKTEVTDLTLGTYRIDNTNGAQVLSDLKQRYGIDSFFRNQTLYVYFAYDKSFNTLKYDFDRNIDMAGNDLEFLKKEDQKVKIRAISLLSDNKKITVTKGDEGGSTFTRHYHNITDKKELEKLASQEHKSFKIDGYRGRFKGFGLPVVRSGDICTIFDGDYPEQSGSYYVDEVNTIFGVNGGFERNIEIGRRAL